MDGRGQLSGNVIWLNDKLPALDVKEVLTHELQHWIQSKEGFVKGGSPKQFQDVYAPVWDDKAQQWVHPESALEQYRRLFGEFEARDSASRMTWGPQERKAVRPYLSEFEPKSGWILR
jgi:hypothetical protein